MIAAPRWLRLSLLAAACLLAAASPTHAAHCGDGNLDPGEDCDQGSLTGTPGSCCRFNCKFEKSDVTCRPSAGQCDVVEMCTGSSDTCPADAFAASATACTGVSSGGVCDTASDHCSGSSNACLDGFQPSSVTCRPSAGACDEAETCSGSSGSCPADSKLTGVCRYSGGDCDATEYCDGSADDCPPDGFVAAGTVCRTSAGDCDAAETCTGVSESCPEDAFETASASCTGSSQGGDCDDDAADHCSGNDNSCVDAFRSSATECRASAGECDAAERCTGSGGACPADAAAPVGTACADDFNSCTDDVCAANGACIHPVNVGPPASWSALMVEHDAISWTAQGDASAGYDLVRGSLAALSAAGDFAAAIEECVVDDSTENWLPYTTNPGAGEAWFFLVRGVSCGGNGTFDATSVKLVGTRDQQIAQSPFACQ